MADVMDALELVDRLAPASERVEWAETRGVFQTEFDRLRQIHFASTKENLQAAFSEERRAARRKKFGLPATADQRRR
jgi:hypothetical protein